MSRFAVLLPVKPLAVAKSRLAGLGDETRRSLARAFALDTAAACLASQEVGGVLVVTDDALVAAALGAIGCAAIPDGVSDDLNGSLRQAAAEAHRRWPGLAPVALCGDLPALDPADLDAALRSVASGTSAYVADAEGVGTTLYTAPVGAFAPRFGLDSRALHEALGAQPVGGVLPTLRRDVDDEDDLRAAAALGLGVHTREAVASLGLVV